MLLQISSVPWPFVTNIETCWLPPRIHHQVGLFGTARMMLADIIVVFDVLTRTPAGAAWLETASNRHEYNVFSIGKARTMDVISHPSPWVILFGSTKNSVDNTLEEERVHSLANCLSKSRMTLTYPHFTWPSSCWKPWWCSWVLKRIKKGHHDGVRRAGKSALAIPWDLTKPCHSLTMGKAGSFPY